MTALRSAHVSLDHVVAELLAFPLTTPESFVCGPVSLSTRVMKEPMRSFWRATEQAMLTRLPALSVDELVHLRDALWFDPSASSADVPLARYLRRFAGGSLESNGGRVVPRFPLTHGHRSPAVAVPDVVARRWWRWLSMAIPPETLLAALDPLPPCTSVNNLGVDLERWLAESGFAETHLHIGAALEFPVFWVATLHALSSDALSPDAWRSPGADFAEGRALAPWLLRAAVVRCVLAGHLAAKRGGSRDTFDCYATKLYETIAARHGLVLAHAFRRAVTEVARGAFLDDRARWWVQTRALYRAIVRFAARWPRPPRDPEGVGAADPIGDLFPVGPGGATTEMGFCAAALAHMEGPGAEDALFQRLFWQVTRLRGVYYRHVVQRPTVPGLSWFIRFFSRIRPGRGHGLDMVRHALRVDGEGHGLRSLEMRTEPGADAAESARHVDALARLAPRVTPCEVGWVLHFTRDRGGGFREGHPAPYHSDSHDDPRMGRQGWRFAAFYRQKRAQALVLGRVLLSWPFSLGFVRGLDVCTDEQGVPTWVIAPLFRYVSEAGRGASRALRDASGCDFPPLRVTAHAGEDFVHLLSGLRRIGEAVEHLGLARGSRIGHGLALGVDPGRWAREVGIVPVSRETRLFDLIWEHRYGRRCQLDATRAASDEVCDEIESIARDMFDYELRAASVVRFVEALYDERALRLCGFSSGPRPEPQDEGSVPWLLLRYLTDPSTFARGQAIVHIDPTPHVARLDALQRALRGQLAREGVVVEVNPSSNLFIADLGHLAHHPLWQIAPFRAAEASQDGVVPVCLGSDNPITFATTIRDEYQLVYDTLIRLGATDSERRQWLDRARTQGVLGRFTMPFDDAACASRRWMFPGSWPRLPP